MRRTLRQVYLRCLELLSLLTSYVWIGFKRAVIPLRDWLDFIFCSTRKQRIRSSIYVLESCCILQHQGSELAFLQIDHSSFLSGHFLMWKTHSSKEHLILSGFIPIKTRLTILSAVILHSISWREINTHIGLKTWILRSAMSLTSSTSLSTSSWLIFKPPVKTGLPVLTISSKSWLNKSPTFFR